MNANTFMRIVDKIQSRYDGDHDLPPEGTPLVTWTDDALLDLILALCERIDKLERKIGEDEPSESMQEYRHRYGPPIPESPEHWRRNL